MAKPRQEDQLPSNLAKGGKAILEVPEIRLLVQRATHQRIKALAAVLPFDGDNDRLGVVLADERIQLREQGCRCEALALDAVVGTKLALLNGKAQVKEADAKVQLAGEGMLLAG